MNLVDLTFPMPAANLACDEALLDWRDEEEGGDILRFWEAREYFVVVGYGNRIATEVNVAACETDGIPILRRCSGGGTVLQGPGCLNYSLILKVDEVGPLASVSSSNRFIMERNRAALESAGEGPTPARLAIRGHTDLALVTEQKISGNAQRRKKRFLLFHGTFLLDFDLSLIEKFLRMPSKQPDYRQNRPHDDFVANFSSSAGRVKKALQDAWRAHEPLENFPDERIKLLLRDKYVTDMWNRRFQ